jgi:high-affinity iron transporter
VGVLAQVDSQFAGFCSASCILGGQVWDLGGVLPDRQFPGILLKAFFGYTQKLYWVQAIAYVLFLATVGTAYLRSITGWSRSPVKQATET